MAKQGNPFENHPAFSVDPATLRRLTEAANRVVVPSDFPEFAERAKKLLKNVPTSPELAQSIARVREALNQSLRSALPDDVLDGLRVQLPAGQLERIQTAASGLADAWPPDSRHHLSDELAAMIFDADEAPDSPDRRLTQKQLSRVTTFFSAWVLGYGLTLETVDRLVGPDEYAGQSITWGAFMGLMIAIAVLYGVDHYGPKDGSA